LRIDLNLTSYVFDFSDNLLFRN